MPVEIVEEDREAANAAGIDMKDAAGKLLAKWSCHAAESPLSGNFAPPANVKGT